MTARPVFLGFWLGVLAASTGCSNEITKTTGGDGGAGSTSTSTKSTSSTATSMQGSTSTGPAKNSGDCDSDADCPPDGTCVELTPGGFRVCKFPVPVATACTDPMNDQCCDSTDCDPGETCFPGPLLPHCGGPQILPHNQCGEDQCSSPFCDVGLCAPGGTVNNKIAVCLTALCYLDTDCTAHAGGICATYTDSCCNAPTGLFCIYPGINCRSDADCPGGHCALNEGGSPTCMPGGAPCPE